MTPPDDRRCHDTCIARWWPLMRNLIDYWPTIWFTRTQPARPRTSRSFSRPVTVDIGSTSGEAGIATRGRLRGCGGGPRYP